MPRRRSRRPEPAAPEPARAARLRNRRPRLVRRGRRRGAADGARRAPRGRDRRLPAAAATGDRRRRAGQDGADPAPDRARRPPVVAIAVYGLATSGGGSDNPAPTRSGDAEDRGRDDPRGLHALADRRRRQGRRAERRLREGDSEGPEGLRHRQVPAPPRTPASRASCSRPPTSSRRTRASTTSSRTSSPPSTTTSRQVDLKTAKKKNLTIYDVVTIASMIEREVLVPKERPLVAAVIYNRLAQGIPLGIDATLRYDLDNFDKPLTESDLADRQPLQHAAGHRPAADADRQPRPRLAEGGGRSGQRRLPLLRRQAGHLRRALLHRATTTSSSPPPTSTTLPARPQGGSPTDC